MLAMAKRTRQVNVHMSPEDLDEIKKAAATLWPGLELTTSTAVLQLAKRAAREILHPTREKKAK